MLDFKKKTKFKAHLKRLDISHIHRRILFGEKNNALFEDAISIVFTRQEAQTLTHKEIVELKKLWDKALEAPKKKDIIETIAFSLMLLLAGIISAVIGAGFGGMIGAGWGLIIAGPAGLLGGAIGGVVVGALLGIFYLSVQISSVRPAPCAHLKTAEDKTQKASNSSVRPDLTAVPPFTSLIQPQSTAEQRPMQTQQQALSAPPQSRIPNNIRA